MARQELPWFTYRLCKWHSAHLSSILGVWVCSSNNTRRSLATKHAMQHTATFLLRYRKLAHYIAPKRKAIEVTGEGGGPVKTEMTVRELLDAINGQSLGPPSEREEF